jgi:hypothetical protein
MTLLISFYCVSVNACQKAVAANSNNGYVRNSKAFEFIFYLSSAAVWFMCGIVNAFPSVTSLLSKFR